MQRRGLAAVLVGLVAIAGGVAFIVLPREDGHASISRPWTRAEVSEDGTRLTLWVEKPGDPGCEVFDHIEVKHSNRTTTAAAIYTRTDQEFCIVPCPLQDEPQTVTLDQPLTQVSILHASGATPSCRT